MSSSNAHNDQLENTFNIGEVNSQRLEGTTAQQKEYENHPDSRHAARRAEFKHMGCLLQLVILVKMFTNSGPSKWPSMI